MANQLRPALLNRVLEDVIPGTLFARDDFSVREFEGPRTSSKQKRNYVEIQLSERQEFFFRVVPSTVRDPLGGDSACFEVTMAPGVATTEQMARIDPDELSVAVHDWLGRVQEDIEATIALRRAKEQQAQIDQLIEQFEAYKNAGEGYFTRAEAQEWTRRLDVLEQDFDAQIRAAADTEKAANERIAALATEIETLKQQLDMRSKKSWLRSAVARMFAWSADTNTQKVLGAGANIAVRLIADGTHGTLPPHGG